MTWNAPRTAFFRRIPLLLASLPSSPPRSLTEIPSFYLSSASSVVNEHTGPMAQANKYRASAWRFYFLTLSRQGRLTVYPGYLQVFLRACSLPLAFAAPSRTYIFLHNYNLFALLHIGVVKNFSIKILKIISFYYSNALPTKSFVRKTIIEICDELLLLTRRFVLISGTRDTGTDLRVNVEDEQKSSEATRAKRSSR